MTSMLQANKMRLEGNVFPKPSELGPSILYMKKLNYQEDA